MGTSWAADDPRSHARMPIEAQRTPCAVALSSEPPKDVKRKSEISCRVCRADDESIDRNRRKFGQRCKFGG